MVERLSPARAALVLEELSDNGCESSHSRWGDQAGLAATNDLPAEHTFIVNVVQHTRLRTEIEGQNPR